MPCWPTWCSAAWPTCPRARPIPAFPVRRNPWSPTSATTAPGPPVSACKRSCRQASTCLATIPLSTPPQPLSTDIPTAAPRPASVSVQALLPAGVALLGQHPASAPPRSMPGGGTRIDWRLTLPPGQVVSLVVQVGSHSPGQYDIPLQVQADASNQSLTHRLHIATPAALALDATQALALLQAPA